LLLLGLRVSAGYLTRGGCGKVVDGALHPIAPPIALRARLAGHHFSFCW